MGQVGTHFRPEFINRLDEILIFNRLGREAIREIVDVQLKRIAKRFADQDMFLEVNDEARDWLANRGCDPAFGARPLKRVLRKELEDRAARLLLSGQAQPGTTIFVSVRDGELAVHAGGTVVDSATVDGHDDGDLAVNDDPLVMGELDAGEGDDT